MKVSLTVSYRILDWTMSETTMISHLRNLPAQLAIFAFAPQLSNQISLLSLFSTEGEFVRANREKKQLDWLATNTDDITTQFTFCLFARKKSPIAGFMYARHLFCAIHYRCLSCFVEEFMF